jgi:hypothetical protein
MLALVLVLVVLGALAMTHPRSMDVWAFGCLLWCAALGIVVLRGLLTLLAWPL